MLTGRGLMSSYEQPQFPDLFRGVESVKDEPYLCRSENKKLEPPQCTSENKSTHRIRRPTEGWRHTQGRLGSLARQWNWRRGGTDTAGGLEREITGIKYSHQPLLNCLGRAMLCSDEHRSPYLLLHSLPKSSIRARYPNFRILYIFYLNVLYH